MDSKPRRRALVVDDYADAAEGLARMLETLGCTATFVTDSTRAMEAATAMEPDVVYIDLGMPHINGFELATVLRARYGKSIRLIAVTAYGGTPIQTKCREAGFDSHLQKPVQNKALERTLARSSFRARAYFFCVSEA